MASMNKVENLFGSYMNRGTATQVLNASRTCTSVLKLRRYELVHNNIHDENIEPVQQALDYWLEIEKQFNIYLKDK